jgi:hypothetical protein
MNKSIDIKTNLLNDLYNKMVLYWGGWKSVLDLNTLYSLSMSDKKLKYSDYGEFECIVRLVELKLKLISYPNDKKRLNRQFFEIIKSNAKQLKIYQLFSIQYAFNDVFSLPIERDMLLSMPKPRLVSKEIKGVILLFNELIISNKSSHYKIVKGMIRALLLNKNVEHIDITVSYERIHLVDEFLISKLETRLLRDFSIEFNSKIFLTCLSGDLENKMIKIQEKHQNETGLVCISCLGKFESVYLKNFYYSAGYLVEYQFSIKKHSSRIYRKTN